MDKKKLFEQMKELAFSKPGFDLCNYNSLASYKQDYREYKKYADKNRLFFRSWTGNNFITVLESIDDENLSYFISNCRFDPQNAEKRSELDYIPGQYYCVEYQYWLYMLIEKIGNWNYKNKGGK